MRVEKPKLMFITILFSRSLVERLLVSHYPSTLLTEQFRMHPEIRKFPSDYFYAGRLTDADSVISRNPEPWYDVGFFKPYIFFDVKGNERKVSCSNSYENIAEANTAVELFKVSGIIFWLFQLYFYYDCCYIFLIDAIFILFLEF